MTLTGDLEEALASMANRCSEWGRVRCAGSASTQTHWALPEHA